MKNVIGLWCNLGRAVEIAKLGGFSVSVYFDDEYKAGFDDYKVIKEFYKGWFDNFAFEGDLMVQIHKPNSYELKGVYETKEDIQLRIDKAKNFPKPEFILDVSAQSLLRIATNRLQLSLLQIEKIKEITATIAQLELSGNVDASHVAEAVNYSYIRGTYGGDFSGYNPESESKVFGDMISIKPGEIDRDAAQAAIDYLAKFI